MLPVDLLSRFFVLGSSGERCARARFARTRTRTLQSRPRPRARGPGQRATRCPRCRGGGLRPPPPPAGSASRCPPQFADQPSSTAARLHPPRLAHHVENLQFASSGASDARTCGGRQPEWTSCHRLASGAGFKEPCTRLHGLAAVADEVQLDTLQEQTESSRHCSSHTLTHTWHNRMGCRPANSAGSDALDGRCAQAGLSEVLVKGPSLAASAKRPSACRRRAWKQTARVHRRVAHERR